MAVHDYQSVMLPLLKMEGNGNKYRIRSLIELLSREIELSLEDRRQLLPIGSQPVFDNRVNWVKTYLKKLDCYNQRIV